MSTELKSLIGRLNPTCRRVLEGAAELCLRRTNYDVEVEHVLYRLLEAERSDVGVVLRHFDRDPARTLGELTEAMDRMKRGNSRTPAFSPRVPRLLERAWLVSSLQLGEDTVRSGALLLALLEEESLRGALLESAPSLLQIPRQALRDNLRELVRASPEKGGGGRPLPAEGNGAASAAPGAADGGALGQFTVDLTAQARSGAIDPIRGRDGEIRQVVDILLRRRQNNPLLAGEAGVGKTAVVEGLALRIAEGEVPASLRDVRLLTLDLGLLQAGAGIKGEFEHRLKSVIDEVKASVQPTILFVDEAHTLIGAGGQEGQGDAANLLKPALARGELRTIAATTWSEYKRYFEKDPALARRFQVVRIEEPDEERAVEMLRAVSANLQRHHGVPILDEAVQEAVRLSHRYIPGRQLPDKAIGVLDTAAARVAVSQDGVPASVEAARRRIQQLELELEVLQREQASGGDHRARLAEIGLGLDDARVALVEVEDRWRKELSLAAEIDRLRRALEEAAGGDGARDPLPREKELAFAREELRALQGDDPLVHPCVDGHTIASVISDWTGIPVGKMLKDEIRSVLGLRARLADRIIGQPDALDSLVRRIQTYRANLEDPDKPVGVFLLVGPSGVGKTETAITLADHLYGGERNMVVVNMSEYQEAHSISSLRGAPPGYVGYGRGGVLTEAVRRRPYSVVLLDEVEKAHADVMELFFQVFDKGKLEDGEGQLVDFKNTLILLTSNVGSERIVEAARGGTRPDPEALVEAIRPDLLRHFSPAFLGRLVIVPYLPLRDGEIAEVVGLKLAAVQRRFWQQHEADLTYADDVVQAIARRCTEVDSGARNVDSIISHALLPGLSTRILERMARAETFRAVHVEAEAGGGFSYGFSGEGA